MALIVAFEGGGAKALVHVGALKAIEARGFEFSQALRQVRLSPHSKP
jgi:predicted acylesterase/phospholipase RssA